MPAAAIGAVVTAGSAYMQNRAQKKAANAAQNAADASNAQQQLIYENARGDLKPYQDLGLTGIAGLNALAAGDYSGFQNSPDYQFALQQGLQGVDRSAASRGALYSGGQLADLNNYAQGMASQNLGTYRNFLTGLAGMGQNASGMIAGVGQNNANAQSGNNWGAAGAAGNSAINQANNWSQLGAGLGGLANNLLQQNAAGRQSSFTPSNSLWSGQASTGAGSAYNIGNNLSNLTGWRA